MPKRRNDRRLGGVNISSSEITRLIESCAGGAEDAFDRLFSIIYDELRAIAAFRLNFPDGHDRLARSQFLFGQMLRENGRLAEAEPFLLEAYAFYEREYGSENRATLGAARELINLYNAWGRPETAAQYRTVLH